MTLNSWSGCGLMIFTNHLQAQDCTTIFQKNVREYVDHYQDTIKNAR